MYSLLLQESKLLGSVFLLSCVHRYSPTDIIKNLIMGVQDKKIN